MNGYRITDANTGYVLQKCCEYGGPTGNNFNVNPINAGYAHPYTNWQWVFYDSGYEPGYATPSLGSSTLLQEGNYLLKLAYLKKMILLKLDVESDTKISVNDKSLNDIEWNDNNISLQRLLRTISRRRRYFTIKDIDKLIERIDNK